jgi:hypothetical protein
MQEGVMVAVAYEKRHRVGVWRADREEVSTDMEDLRDGDSRNQGVGAGNVWQL